MSRAVGKHVKSKTPPPEVVGIVERPVKTHPPKQKSNALQPHCSAFAQLLREPLALLVGKELIAMDKIKAP